MINCLAINYFGINNLNNVFICTVYKYLLCFCLQATIPGILCGPITAELVTASGGKWFPVFLVAAFVNFTGAIVYFTHSIATQVL